MENKNTAKGIICIIFSSFCFALMGMFVHLAGSLPSAEKAFFRNIVAFLVAFPMVIKDRKSVSLPKGSAKWLFFRCAAGSIGIFGNFYALDRIPIADAAILNKMSPFFSVLFSFLILGEKIKPFPFFCILGAFLGSAFVIKPSAGIMTSFPAIIAFLGGMGAGFAYSCVRKLGKSGVSGPLVITVFSAFSCLLSLPFMFFGFVPMSLNQILILLGAGIAASGGQFGITYAYYFASPRDISVFDYSQIIFSAVLGFVFFSQVPDVFSLAGYGIIILMAVLVFFYNKKMKT